MVPKLRSLSAFSTAAWAARPTFSCETPDLAIFLSNIDLIDLRISSGKAPSATFACLSYSLCIAGASAPLASGTKLYQSVLPAAG